MALFRYNPQVEPFVLEVSWPKGKSYKKGPITVQVLKRRPEGGFELHEQLAEFHFEGRKERTLKSESIGPITLKFTKRLLLFTELEVFVDGQKLKGSEVLKTVTQQEIAHVK